MSGALTPPVLVEGRVVGADVDACAPEAGDDVDACAPAEVLTAP